MNPVLADAIDIPYVIGYGLAVLVPLLAFEVGVEALVLKPVWNVPFGRLCRFTFIANCLSLLAGIPVKMLNSLLYAWLLPEDLPGFFARYPVAVALGSFVYFVATLGVEGAYAFRWLRRQQLVLTTGRLWKGIVLANLASYGVLAPLHYYLTQPTAAACTFTPDIGWFHGPAGKVIFVDAATGQLKAVRLDGSDAETLVPLTVKDYLVSADLNLCLFRGAGDNLYLYQREPARTNLVCHPTERFLMNQAAFSPSGQYAAFVGENGQAVEMLDVSTGRQVNQPLGNKLSDFRDLSLAWSTNETQFFVGNLEISILPSDTLAVVQRTGTNQPVGLPCYGRVGSDQWYGADNWGCAFHEDVGGDLHFLTEPGLESGLYIYRDGPPRTTVLNLSVNPGLLHLALFDFEDVAALADGRACLFTASGRLYLLDIPGKRVGTVAHGDRFILLTPRYQKQL